MDEDNHVFESLLLAGGSVSGGSGSSSEKEEEEESDDEDDPVAVRGKSKSDDAEELTVNDPDRECETTGYNATPCGSDSKLRLRHKRTPLILATPKAALRPLSVLGGLASPSPAKSQATSTPQRTDADDKTYDPTAHLKGTASWVLHFPTQS